MQAQQALALLPFKLVGRPGTESLPSTFASPDLNPYYTKIQIYKISEL